MGTEKEDLNGLGAASPRWDLRGLFPSPESPDFIRAIEQVEDQAALFHKQYAGRIGKLDGDQLAEAIAAYQDIAERAARINAYVALTAAADHGRARWASDVRDRMAEAASPLLCLPLEINQMREADLLNKITAPALSGWSPWIGFVRSLRDHQLSEAAEKYLRQKTVTAEGTWKRFYDMTMNDIAIRHGDRTLSAAETIDTIRKSHDRAARRALWQEFHQTLNAHEKSLSLIFNTAAEMRSVEDKLRNFTHAEENRHMRGQIDPAQAEAMMNAVRAGYGRTAHRYYTWKAKKTQVKAASKMHPADMHAPLALGATSMTWPTARDTVVAAYDKLSPAAGAAARRFFDEGWIDAAPRPGKRGGAFCHPGTKDTHPFILINFTGAPEDVLELGRQIGQGVQYLLAAEQAHLKGQLPETLVAAAGSFGAAIVFEEMLACTEDIFARRALLALGVEDMLKSVTHPAAVYTFEQRAHAELRAGGELAPERLAEIWRETQKESNGAAIHNDAAGAGHGWMLERGVIHDPFAGLSSVYGACLGNMLQAASVRDADFADKYMTLLKTGGTSRQDVALAPFGFDLSDAAFWRDALSGIERRIDALIALDRKIEFTHAANDLPPAANDAAPAGNKKTAVRKKGKGGKGPAA